VSAFRFNALVLVASAVLLAFKVVRPLIPLCFLASYLLLVRLFAPLFGSGTVGSGDVLLALLTSGTLMAAFFLLDTPGTVPVSRRGKIVYALGAGGAAFVFCGSGTSPVGSAVTVLAANLLSVFIQFAELLSRGAKFRRVTKPSMEDYANAAK
jgi:electron transport complex protein RnfD